MEKAKFCQYLMNQNSPEITLFGEETINHADEKPFFYL